MRRIFLIVFFLIIIIGTVMYQVSGSNEADGVMKLPFQSNQERWKKVRYQGLLVADKTLSGIVATESDFKDFVFENVVFKDSVFDTVSFERSTFKNVIFDHVRFTHPYRPDGKDHLAADEDLSSVRFENVQFKHCDFENILMEDSILDGVVFDKSELNNINIDSLGGELSLINSNGAKMLITAHGKMNYRQIGGKFDVIVIEDIRKIMHADLFKIDKAEVRHLAIMGSIENCEISNSQIQRLIPGIRNGRLFVENSQFHDILFDISAMQSVSFLNSNIAEEIQIFRGDIKKMLFIDTRLDRLEIDGEVSIEHIDLIRTPFNKIELGAGKINKLTLKQIPLPGEWEIGEEGSIGLLEIKQPLFPKAFRYQGKPLSQCQVQLGGELQTYTNLPGERLPEVLKKQVVLEGVEHVG